MKRVIIVQAAVLIAIAIMISSCSSGRQYSRYYPPRPANFSLIINSSPGYTVHRSPDGRYYYRLPNGYTYWRGADQRYYLDRRYINKRSYQHQQYRDWKRNGRRYYR